MHIKDVIIRPIITEKSLSEAQEFNRFTFIVDKRSTKNHIKEALKAYFDVDAVSVRTSILPGKWRRTGRRQLPSPTSPVKKAIVQLKKGQTISAFESQS